MLEPTVFQHPQAILMLEVAVSEESEVEAVDLEVVAAVDSEVEEPRLITEVQSGDRLL